MARTKATFKPNRRRRKHSQTELNDDSDNEKDSQTIVDSVEDDDGQDNEVLECTVEREQVDTEGDSKDLNKVVLDLEEAKYQNNSNDDRYIEKDHSHEFDEKNNCDDDRSIEKDQSHEFDDEDKVDVMKFRKQDGGEVEGKTEHFKSQDTNFKEVRVSDGEVVSQKDSSVDFCLDESQDSKISKSSPKVPPATSRVLRDRAKVRSICLPEINHNGNLIVDDDSNFKNVMVGVSQTAEKPKQVPSTDGVFLQSKVDILASYKSNSVIAVGPKFKVQVNDANFNPLFDQFRTLERKFISKSGKTLHHRKCVCIHCERNADTSEVELVTKKSRNCRLHLTQCENYREHLERTGERSVLELTSQGVYEKPRQRALREAHKEVIPEPLKHTINKVDLHPANYDDDAQTIFDDIMLLAMADIDAQNMLSRRLKETYDELTNMIDSKKRKLEAALLSIKNQKRRSENVMDS
jgi:hypothetical protein